MSPEITACPPISSAAATATPVEVNCIPEARPLVQAPFDSVSRNSASTADSRETAASVCP